jgi:hypothetical protein
MHGGWWEPAVRLDQAAATSAAFASPRLQAPGQLTLKRFAWLFSPSRHAFHRSAARRDRGAIDMPGRQPLSQHEVTQAPAGRARQA